MRCAKAQPAKVVGILVEAVEGVPFYAGLWLEQPSGKLHVAATDVAAMTAFLAAYPAFDVTVVPARYPYDELRALQDQVVADVQSGGLGNVRMASVGVDQMENVSASG